MSELKFPDRNTVDSALGEVRNANSPVDWAAFTYEGNDTSKASIVLHGKGGGGLGALSSTLKNDQICYCLLRVIDVIDEHPTVKFVYITWIGSGVKFMQKAKITPHKGSATAFIGQAHVSLTAENLGEMTEEIVMDKVRDASGSNDRTVRSGDSHERVVAPAAKPTVQPVFTAPKERAPSTTTTTTSSTSSVPKSSSSSVPRSTSGGAVGSPKKIDAGQKKNDVVLPSDKDAINAVRSDSDPTDWCLYSYEGNTNNIVLVGSGTGGLSEMRSHFADNRFMYGLLRVVDQYDATANTRFVYIVWVGEKLPIMRKALITTHKGVVTGFIGQAHVELNWTNLSEATEEQVVAKVSSAAGTRSFVLDGAVEGSGRIHLSGGI